MEKPAPETATRAAKQAGLVYVTDMERGIRRKRAGGRFTYVNTKGRPIRDKGTLARIKSLAVPPAWEEVWISPHANGHLQATGRDARGRKQHRYHPRFREVREAAKFSGLVAFGRALPKIRAHIARDMRKQGLPREKVLAAVIELIDNTLIRVGNDEYARANKSYGITTLKDQHAEIKGETLRFHFMGKSGKTWKLTLKHKRVAKVVKAAQDLPGQRLFQYLGSDGAQREITSSDVNAYLREISGADLTAKEFRTWGATVLAAAVLKRLGKFDTLALANANVKQTVEEVAQTLGNTPAICRKCYIHPGLIEAYLEGGFNLRAAKRAGLSAPEASVLAFLSRPVRKRTPRGR